MPKNFWWLWFVAFSLAIVCLTSSTISKAAEITVARRISSPIEKVVHGGALRRPLSTLAISGQTVVAAQLTSDPVTTSSVAIVIEQQQFLRRCLAEPGVTLLGQARKVLNMVFLKVDTDAYAAIAQDPAVRTLHPVGTYQLALQDTIPYVGATAVQALNVDGSGVTVAVIDSGIDYHHVSLGGSGQAEVYAANDANIIEPGSFPTSKVIGGYDFVGSVWPNGPLAPDPDPLDQEGHGTHVADIIGGVNGVAPGASLYALQACSATTPLCSGTGLILAMDFAADPNGDGDPSDHVDIINLSLGSQYGQPFDDDLSAAVENAARLGILTVTSAGNGGDRPYVLSTPAATKSALAVGQTHVPSAVQDLMEVTSPSAVVGAYLVVHQSWSAPLTEVVQGEVQYGDGSGGNLRGCAAFASGALVGKLVMVDRGDCSFTAKIRHIQEAGGRLGLIGLVAPGSPFDGGFGGGEPISIPGFIIDEDIAGFIRDTIVDVRFDPSAGVLLAGSMVASSSRGPQIDNRLKPDISAPGASLSAEVGTGTANTPFGGTSGASPMVAGAAALLWSDEPELKWWQVKVKLQNYARSELSQDITGLDAPLSRMGAGELDVLQAYWGQTLAFNPVDKEAKLDFGYVPVARRRTLGRRLRIVNRSIQDRWYYIRPVFRSKVDPDDGAVRIFVRRSVFVPAQSSRTLPITLTIFADRLPNNLMNSGRNGNDPTGLSANEFSGHIMIYNDEEELSVPWYVLPRKSSRVRVRGRRALRFRRNDQATVRLVNTGMGTAGNRAFTLMATSERQPSPVPGTGNPRIDLKAVGVRTTPVPAGLCGPERSFVLEVAFQLWDPTALVHPVIHQVNIDLNGDNVPDAHMLNGDRNLLTRDPGLDGRNISIVITNFGLASAWFFTEHATNTRNTIISACAEQFGFSPADYGQRLVTMTFATRSAYYRNTTLADTTQPVTFILGAERYTAEVKDLAPYERVKMRVIDHHTRGPELGILLFTNVSRALDNHGGATPRTEGLIFRPAGMERTGWYRDYSK